MFGTDSGEQFAATKKYFLDNFPESYQGCRRYAKSGDLHFLLQLKDTVRIVVFTSGFFEEHPAQAIPACLEEHRLADRIRYSQFLYLIVGQEKIDEMSQLPKPL